MVFIIFFISDILGLYATMTCMLNEGDEVFLFGIFDDLGYINCSLLLSLRKCELLWCCYKTNIQLKSKSEDKETDSLSDLVLDLDELRSLMTEKTKLHVLNTPHNPRGKTFLFSRGTRRHCWSIRRFS